MNKFFSDSASLAFHYVQHFDLTCSKINHCLKEDENFVFISSITLAKIIGLLSFAKAINILMSITPH